MWLRIVVFALAFAIIAPLRAQYFEINTQESRFSVSDHYLSVTIDSTCIVSWQEYEAAVFSNPFATALVSELSPAYLRIGGTYSDMIIYNLQESDSSDNLPYNAYQMNGSQWDVLNQFAKTTNLDLIFTVNVATRTASNTWNSTNFEALLLYTAQHDYPVSHWELSNEPDALQSNVGISVSPQQLASDYHTFRNVLNQNGFSNSSVLGPAVCCPTDGYMASFASSLVVLGNVVTDVTYHQYYAYGPNTTSSDFYNAAFLDILISTLSLAQTEAEPLTSSGSNTWSSETSSTWGGGTAGASNTFAAGFIWLDKLGLAPLFGLSVVCRQDFYGGNYGLFQYPNIPLPDYWTSVLFKQIVGTRVLEVTNSTQLGRTVRVYSFCSRNITGGVVAIVINTNNATTTIAFSAFSIAPRFEYILTSPAGDMASQQIQLNGHILQATTDGGLPSLAPTVVTDSSSIVMPPLAYGFFVFPDANAPACL